MKLKTGTIVFVGDSEKCLVLRNQGDEEIIDLRVQTALVEDNPSTREQGTDRPGRFPTPNAQFSAVSNADWHLLKKDSFANELSSLIEKSASNEEIILIADAKTLGRIRPALSKTVKSQIRAEITKDLTHHTIPAIEKIIEQT